MFASTRILTSFVCIYNLIYFDKCTSSFGPPSLDNVDILIIIPNEYCLRDCIVYQWAHCSLVLSLQLCPQKWRKLHHQRIIKLWLSVGFRWLINYFVANQNIFPLLEYCGCNDQDMIIKCYFLYYCIGTFLMRGFKSFEEKRSYP